MTTRAIVLLEREGGVDVARWASAAAIVLAAHLGLMATYLLFFSQPPIGVPESPAVVIDLAPLPVAPCFSDGRGAGPRDGGGAAAARAGGGRAQARADHRAAATRRWSLWSHCLNLRSNRHRHRR